MKKEDLMRNILTLEWEMFSTVQNKGGKASCQEDYRTFAIMRAAQLDVWGNDVLASYFLDLMEAKESGRNLMTEKYARMMEKTYPEEYEKISGLLPAVSEKAKEIARSIVRIYSVWEKEMRMRYPKLRNQGRHSGADIALDGSVSVDDYQYCEYLTYSERTLTLLLEYIGEHATENLYLQEVLNICRAYGYKSLEEAENSL